MVGIFFPILMKGVIDCRGWSGMPVQLRMSVVVSICPLIPVQHIRHDMLNISDMLSDLSDFSNSKNVSKIAFV